MLLYSFLFFLSPTSSTIIPSQTDFLQIPLLTHNHQNGTSSQSAAKNANRIFNTLHSAVRQFGSSYHHNGMSVIPATVPAGINLYHGRHDKERVVGLEWSSFEMEHAEHFARDRGDGGPGPGNGRRPDEPPEDLPSTFEVMNSYLSQVSEDPSHPRRPPRWPTGPGYLHTYRTNRPLNLLYFDGMAAAKSTLGTLDTQDILLLNRTSSSPLANRAQDLCALPKLWNVPIDGFIRMEAGFEIIHCDFSTEGGLDLVEARRRPESSGGVGDHPEGYNILSHFEHMRAASLRYSGISASRVELRFEDMISAYFYPINFTNPDREYQVLPRLPLEDVAELEKMRQDLRHVLANPRDDKRLEGKIDWQGITDMIVTRYAGRLQYVASNPGYSIVLSEINNLLNTYINYDGDFDKTKSIENCASNYITTAKAFSTWTRQDHLLQAAVTHVSREICTTLFDVRDDLLAESGDEKPKASLAVNKVKDLMTYLDWSTWRECGGCAYDEVCFISMWPYGGREEHFHPSCKNRTTLEQGPGENDYWGPRL